MKGKEGKPGWKLCVGGLSGQKAERERHKCHKAELAQSETDLPSLSRSR